MDYGKKRQLLLLASRWPKYGELRDGKNFFNWFSPSACGLVVPQESKKNKKSFCHPSVPPSFGISCQIKSTFFFSYVHTIFFQRWIEFFQLTRLLLYNISPEPNSLNFICKKLFSDFWPFWLWSKSFQVKLVLALILGHISQNCALFLHRIFPHCAVFHQHIFPFTTVF